MMMMFMYVFACVADLLEEANICLVIFYFLWSMLYLA